MWAHRKGCPPRSPPIQPKARLTLPDKQTLYLSLPLAELLQIPGQIRGRGVPASSPLPQRGGLGPCPRPCTFLAPPT